MRDRTIERMLAIAATLAGVVLVVSDRAAADTKISAMPSAAALTGPELMPVVQSGANATTTPSALLTYIQAQATSINGVALTPLTTGFSVAGGTTSKTLTVSNTITLAGTDGLTYTLPASSSTLAMLNIAQSFSGAQTFTGSLIVGAALKATGTTIIGSATAPTACTVAGVSTCTVTKNAGSFALKYTLTAGTPTGSTVTLALPSATDGYVCDGVTIPSGLQLQETTDSPTAPVLTAYTPAGVATIFSPGDALLVKCLGY